jgi:aminoglycoside phosphotransferase
MSALAAITTLSARRRLAAVVDVGPRTWQPLCVTRRDAGAIVVELGPHAGAVEAIAKIAGPAASAAVRAETKALERLAPVARSGGWSSLLPETIAAGDVAGGAYLVQRVLPGVNARRLLVDGTPAAPLVRAAATGLAPVHAGATTTRVDADSVRLWVEEPCAFVASALRGRRRTRALRRLAAETAALLDGATVRVGWTHGDFWLGNVLVDDECTVTGIVDWDCAADAYPPHLDLLHLLLYGRSIRRRRPFGHIVRTAIDSPGWSESEAQVLAAYGDDYFTNGGSRAAVTLTWLRHVTQNLSQFPYYARAPLWVRRNVDAVLEAV